jgi:hypothetical protein
LKAFFCSHTNNYWPTFLGFGLWEETNILGFWLVRRNQHFWVLACAKRPTFLGFGLCEETSIFGIWFVRRDQHFWILSSVSVSGTCRILLTSSQQPNLRGTLKAKVYKDWNDKDRRKTLNKELKGPQGPRL